MCPARVKPKHRGRLARWTSLLRLHCVSSERRPLPARIPARWTHLQKDTYHSHRPFEVPLMPSHTSQKMCPARVKPSHRERLARWTRNKPTNGVSSERKPLPVRIPARWTHLIKGTPIFIAIPFEFHFPLMLWHTYKSTCPNGTKSAPSLPFSRLDTPKPAQTRVQTVGAAPSKGSTRLDTAQQEDTHHALSNKPISPDNSRQKTPTKKVVQRVQTQSPSGFHTLDTILNPQIRVQRLEPSPRATSDTLDTLL